MAGLERHQHRRERREPDEPPSPDAPAPQLGARKAELDAEIDDILDDIDAVLESNAEEFVAGFIQKGGQ